MQHPLLSMARILVGLVSLSGWILGIVAFFRVRRLSSALEALRPHLQQREPAVLRATALPSIDSPEPPASSGVAAPRRNIEALLTLRWGMWVGAAALLLSGIFLVRYAADEGWLTAPVRCIGLVLLGMLLVGSAEALRRRGPVALQGRPLPDLAPAALAAGGVSMLFAAAYAAGTVYRLLPPAASLVLTASVSLGALRLSQRFGRLVAAVGIAGAFATPLLVQDGQASLPLLFSYLLLVSVSGLAVQRRTQWDWLGWITLAAGGAWTALACVSPDMTHAPDGLWPPALFAPFSAALHLVGSWGENRRRRTAAIAIPTASLLLLALAFPALVVAIGLLLLALVAAAGGREARTTWLGAAGPLLLLGAWSRPGWLHGVLATAPLGPVPATAAAAAVLLGLHGLRMERRQPDLPAWSTLPALLPTLCLAVWHLGPLTPHRFPGLLAWLAVLILLAAVLSVHAARLRSASELPRAGIHAAGAAAALALALAGTLQALTLPLGGAAGLAPLVPALGLIVRAGLPTLRPATLLVAASLLAWPFVTFAWMPMLFADRPALVARLPSMMVLVLCFGLGSRLSAMGRHDRLDRLLEAGTVLLTAVLAAMLIRGLGHFALPGPDFGEAALDTAFLWLLALLWLGLSQCLRPPPGDRPWQAAGLAALAASLLLMLWSPLFKSAVVGPRAMLDALLPAYGIPALVALQAATWLAQSSKQQAPARWLPRFALLSGFVWLSLEVRHLFHPAGMALDVAPVGEIELWALSGAWLGFGTLLMATGLARRRPLLRQAGLIVLVLTVLKVLLIDTGGLAGIWRVLSFLALGLTLIALGAAYRRFGTETFTTPDVAALHKPEEKP